MTRTRNTLLILLLLAVITSGLSAQNARGGLRTPAPVTYSVTVTANIRNATIYIDDERQWDRSPATFQLRAGTYVFRVESRGYETWQERITISGNATIRVDLVPPVATIILRIPSDLLNYEVRDPWRLIDVFVDGRIRHQDRIEVEPGWREIAIVSGGLRLEGEVYLESGKTYTVEMLLRMSVNETSGGWR